MKRIALLFLSLSVSALAFAAVSFAAGITQETVIISVPKDYHTSERYKAEFAVPEGSAAFNFTVWGAGRPWGIVDMSGRELYSSERPGSAGNASVGDAESPENVVGPPAGDEGIDSLSTLILYPGTYIIWTEGSPGSTITVQYLLQIAR